MASPCDGLLCAALQIVCLSPYAPVAEVTTVLASKIGHRGLAYGDLGDFARRHTFERQRDGGLLYLLTTPTTVLSERRVTPREAFSILRAEQERHYLWSIHVFQTAWRGEPPSITVLFRLKSSNSGASFPARSYTAGCIIARHYRSLQARRRLQRLRLGAELACLPPFPVACGIVSGAKFPGGEWFRTACARFKETQT